MKQTGKLFLLFLTLTSLFTSKLQAQLYGVGHNKAVLVEYKINNKAIDSIFAYNETPANWNTKSGSLKAVSPDSTGGWTFTLGVFDIDKKKYHDSLPIYLNDSVHVFSNLKAGGYCVRMQKNTIDTTFRAWIFINKLRFYLVKDAEGNIKNFEHTCKWLDIRAVTKYDIPNYKDSTDTIAFFHKNFEYMNPFTGTNHRFINIMNNLWTGDSIYKNNSESLRILDPPAVSTMYTARIYDIFGNTAIDKVYFRTINTKADFDIYVDTITEPRLDPYVRDTSASHYKKAEAEAKGEAPYHAMFVNKSKNGVKFEWIMSDTIYKEKGPIDSAHYFTNDSTSPVFHVYRYPYERKPFKYQLKLVSTGPSPNNCSDTSEIKTIEIEASQFGDNSGNKAFPTAFSPDDTNLQNRYFYFKEKEDNGDIDWKSVQNLHLWIFNKMGKNLYEYNGPIFNGWKGWNGKTKWGLDAGAGVYYYVFEAYGWGKFNLKSTDPNNTGDGSGKDFIRGKGYFFLYRHSK